MYRCTYCEYSTPYLHNLKRHEMNKHYKAPTSMTQPTTDYSSAVENRQHLTGYQVRQGGSGVLRTTQQYDPRAKPQIQNNEVKHKGKGPQTSVSYSVTQKPVTNEDMETDTETVSEADTVDISDVEEYDVYEILNDISLAFNHLKDLRDQYRKAFPQLKHLDEEEMDLFLYKYAELKIDAMMNKMAWKVERHKREVG